VPAAIALAAARDRARLARLTAPSQHEQAHGVRTAAHSPEQTVHTGVPGPPDFDDAAHYSDDTHDQPHDRSGVAVEASLTLVPAYAQEGRDIA
jgi:hypothetical protein